MVEDSRLARLKTRNGVIAGVVVAWSVIRGVIDYVSSFDTIEGHMNQMMQIWHFLASPAGNLATFAIGLSWLGFIVFREPKKTSTDIGGSQMDLPPTSVRLVHPPIIATPEGLARQIKVIGDAYKNFEDASKRTHAVWAERVHIDTRESLHKCFGFGINR
jgi:hypothetical protein